MQYLLSDVIIDDVTVAVWIVFEKFLKKNYETVESGLNLA
jgi:hypothetical protein